MLWNQHVVREILSLGPKRFGLKVVGLLRLFHFGLHQRDIDIFISLLKIFLQLSSFKFLSFYVSLFYFVSLCFTNHPFFLSLSPLPTL